ncbi:MAG: NifU-like domain protein [Acidobacteriaceae bacterium]|nr:NifU-like domain protein [Acidobacteriaceae bacterium]
MNSGEFQEQATKVEQMVERVTAIEDESARATALELMQALMDLHGAGFSRIVEVLTESEAGRSALAKLGSDPLICGLLVLYGVHPLALEGRVKSAIEKVSPQLRKQSASVELIDISDTVVRVKIESSGHGCGSSTDSIKQVVEQTIREVAPEVVEIVAEGVTSSASGFVPVNMIQPSPKEEKKYEESTA